MEADGEGNGDVNAKGGGDGAAEDGENADKERERGDKEGARDDLGHGGVLDSRAVMMEIWRVRTFNEGQREEAAGDEM